MNSDAAASHPPGAAWCFPELSGRDLTTIADGWDNDVHLVGGRWIARIPRRPEVVVAARVELRLLSLLARRLPVRVPVPLASCDEHAAMLYERIDGVPLSAEVATRLGTAAVAAQVADVLTVLHGTDVMQARGLGVTDLAGRRWAAKYVSVTAAFTERVVPLLPARVRDRAASWLAAIPDLVVDHGADVLIHKDLGPAHLICGDAGLVGVLDWTDACIGDAAVDYVTVLHDFGATFAAAVGDAAGLDPGMVRRAALYHRLAPWWEVVHGLDRQDERYVQSGVAGVLRRLPGGPGPTIR